MRLECIVSPMQRESVRVRVIVHDDGAPCGVGQLHLKRQWWRRLQRVIEVGAKLCQLPVNITDRDTAAERRLAG
jgi:hypothetical protein